MLTHDQLGELLGVYVPDSGKRAECVELVVGLIEREALLAAFDLGRAAGLSPRRREIISLMLDGLHAQEIADTLGISIHTVREHTRRMRKEYGVASTAALIGKLRHVVKSDDMREFPDVQD